MTHAQIECWFQLEDLILVIFFPPESKNDENYHSYLITKCKSKFTEIGRILNTSRYTTLMCFSYSAFKNHRNRVQDQIFVTPFTSHIVHVKNKRSPFQLRL